MKKIAKIFGGLLIAFSIILFMYGSIKTSRMLEEKEETVQVTEGIELIKESKNENKAKSSFVISGISFLLGIGLILGSRKKSEL